MDKKGGDLILLDIRDEVIFTDYFLICNGQTDRQLKALADGIAEETKEKANIAPWGTEGEPSSGWVLLDYGDVIVLLFCPEMRNYYNLEDLWSNGHIVLRMQ